MELEARRLVFHSVVVLLVGILCGVPLAAAIWLECPVDSVQLWRQAHRGLVLGGVLGLAVAGILSTLSMSRAKTWAPLVFILSNYAFCFSLVFGAIFGQRGVLPSLPVTNVIALLGNSIATFGGLLAAFLLLSASRASLASAKNQ